MDRQGVSSSNLVSVGYDAAGRVLEIEFHGGRIYQYSGVPEARFAALLRAGSKGTYFHDNIRDAYPCRRTK